ncbi:MAG TPA: hypothetical protein ENO36_02385 [Fervidicoccus fontis]|uniref:Transcriptional regulator n=1 Tax=Fervidicoccus fontis TaxID=683846 RepID=A0A7C2UJB1_9CREN|nr:MAG: hypothetical protein C0179_07340 [Fervidicoccus sp.]HEU97688.1 hypothetical protein [Fervidicoccus fontis]
MSEGDGLVIARILRVLKEKEAANAGDIVNLTGLPRYYVLAAFQILYELGYIELIYSKGSHKVYRITEKGLSFLSGSDDTKIAEGEKAEA